MEKQQTMLLEAARVGSIATLHQLLRDDPMILDRAAVNSLNETPLHVAATLGHVEFVKEIVALKPELVNESNSDGSCPLHLASAKGHVDAVEALLRVDTRACLLRDRNQMLPLHLAEAKGRVEAMQLLLGARPEAATACRGGGENILHLCVKRYQLEALRVLVKSSVCSREFLNSRDGDGNTVLHLAVAEKQVETVRVLVSVGGVEVNAANEEGMTALDVLIRSRRDVRDSEIEKTLIKNAGTTSRERHNHNSLSAYNHNSNSSSNNNNKNNSWGGMMKQHADWLDKKKEALMVVASLIATMAFQVAANPPGGVWQEDEPGKHVAGKSVYADKYPDIYLNFFVVNAVAFISSLSIVFLLMSGLPMRRRFFMWVLMLITWAAITAIAMCYVYVIDAIVPTRIREVPQSTAQDYESFANVLMFTVFVWIGLMALLLIAHTIRMLYKFVKMMRKAWVRMTTRRQPSRLTRQNP